MSVQERPRRRLFSALGTILAAFFGVRRGRDAERDVRLSLAQVIVTALCVVAFLIAGLVLLVRYVAGS